MIEDIHSLWDCYSLGIRENNEVHEALRKGISFDKQQYQVKLPWKKVRERLLSNYSNSVTCLKGNLQKRQEPDILQEYERIIKEQHRTKSQICTKFAPYANLVFGMCNHCVFIFAT